MKMNNKHFCSHVSRSKLIARMILFPLCIGGFVSVPPQVNADHIQPQASSPANEGAVHLTATAGSSAYDFGLVRVGTSVKHVFAIRNTMTAPVVLDRAAPSCHCTGALLLPNAEGGMRLAPGQTMQVQVTLEAAGEADPQGRITKTVSVYVVGQPVHPAAVLTLSGRIALSAAFDPPLLDLGAISTGGETDRKVRLLFAAPNARLAVVGDDRLRLQRLSITHTASGDVQTYQVEVPAHADAGPLSAAITVIGDKATTAVLPVTGQLNGSVSSSPPSIIFGVVPAEAAASLDAAHRTRSILLSCPTLRPVDAAAFWAHTIIVHSPGSFWQADLVTQKLSSSTSRQLRVVLNASAPTGQWLTDRAILAFPDGTRLIIPMAGENALPVVDASPAASLPGAVPATAPTLKAVHP